MATGNGWYLIGPLIAVGVVAVLGAVFWRMGLRWTATRDQRGQRGYAIEADPYPEGLAIFGAGDEDDDYGLLSAATVTDAPELADEIRRLLGEAGIRATRAIDRDGRTAVLVFAEELEKARRLVGDTPAR
jgi:hypothetical protein